MASHETRWAGCRYLHGPHVLFTCALHLARVGHLLNFMLSRSCWGATIEKKTRQRKSIKVSSVQGIPKRTRRSCTANMSPYGASQIVSSMRQRRRARPASTASRANTTEHLHSDHQRSSTYIKHSGHTRQGIHHASPSGIPHFRGSMATRQRPRATRFLA
jgi:hypothetical protein